MAGTQVMRSLVGSVGVWAAGAVASAESETTEASETAVSCDGVLSPPGFAGPVAGTFSTTFLNKASARVTKSWRIWSARQRCQPSSSLAAANTPWAWCSNFSSSQRPCSRKA